MCNIHMLWVVSCNSKSDRIRARTTCTSELSPSTKGSQNQEYRYLKQYILVPTVCYNNCSIVTGRYITPPFQKVCPHISGLKFRIRVSEANNCSVPVRWPPQSGRLSQCRLVRASGRNGCMAFLRRFTLYLSFL